MDNDRIRRRIDEYRAEKAKHLSKIEAIDIKINTLEELLEDSSGDQPLFQGEGGKPERGAKPKGKMTMIEAAQMVLQQAGRKMHVKDIWNEITKQALAVSDAKKPIINLNSAMLRMAKHGEMFEKEGSGSPIYWLKGTLRDPANRAV